MMMKSAPASAFIVSQAQLLLQFLVVALNDPAVFCHLDQHLEMGLRRQCRVPVISGFGFLSRPFDEQPLFRLKFGSLVVPTGMAHSHSGKAGSQISICPFTPCDVLPTGRWQREG